MDNIKKIIEILEAIDFSRVCDLKKELEDIKNKLKTPVNITKEVLERLNVILVDEEKIPSNELEFLLKFSSLSEKTKEYFINKLTNSELVVINKINDRIVNSINFYESSINNSVDIDNLLKKLNKESLKFITDGEIEFIIQCMKDKLDVSTQIEILKEINSINSRIFNMYNVSDDEILSISDENLNITNLSLQAIEDLLFEYGINLNEFPIEFQQKLSKYGNLDNMRNILEFLVEENVLKYAVKSFEVITKTLIYSDINKLRILKATNEIDFKDLVKKIPTVLYPPILERKNTVPAGEGSFKSQSGSMINYEKNSEILVKNKISPKKIWDRCYSFFTCSYKAVISSLEGLKTYNISIKDENAEPKSFFSVLGTRNPSIIDIYDVAIEAGAKDYVLSNPSRLYPTELHKFYLIKLARKLGKSDDEIFGTYISGTGKLFMRQKSLTEHNNLSMDIDEIHQDYSAVKVEIPNKNIYDNIFEISNLNNIPDAILDDVNIKALDNFVDFDDTYNFNGTRISRNKVLRYYSALKSNNKVDSMGALIYCIIINSMLDEKEFNNIYNIVKSCVNLEPCEGIQITSYKSENIKKQIGGKRP